MFEAKCTDCGNTATVPFKPTAGKPVYCRACYSKHMSGRPEGRSTDFSFDPKLAWARRGDNWKGRDEPKSATVFSR